VNRSNILSSSPETTLQLDPSDLPVERPLEIISNRLGDPDLPINSSKTKAVQRRP